MSDEKELNNNFADGLMIQAIAMLLIVVFCIFLYLFAVKTGVIVFG